MLQFLLLNIIFHLFMKLFSFGVKCQKFEYRIENLNLREKFRNQESKFWKHQRLSTCNFFFCIYDIGFFASLILDIFSSFAYLVMKCPYMVILRDLTILTKHTKLKKLKTSFNVFN